MKKAMFLTAMTLFIFMAPLQAKIWRVNNSGTGVSCDTNNLQAAHNIASAGDTIHVEASMTNYGSLNLTKRLIIIGTGFYLGLNPETQANLATPRIGTVNFNTGSEGTVICGVHFTETVGINTSNICLMRNFFNDKNILMMTSGSFSNIIIKQNYIDFNGYYGSFISTGGSTFVTNLVIRNNFIFQNSGSYQNILILNNNISGVLENNVLKSASGSGTAINIQNFNVINNILVQGGSAIFANCNITNNIGNGTQFGTLNGNQSNVVMDSVFIGMPLGSLDGQYQLEPGSPALGAGVGGEDIGMFGGTEPYILSGIPPVPAIYYFNTYGSGNQQYIEIRVKARE